MFFRKGNIVTIDFVEKDKASKTGKIAEFNNTGVVIEYDQERDGSSELVQSFIPISSVSEIILIEDVDANKQKSITTQFRS